MTEATHFMNILFDGLIDDLDTFNWIQLLATLIGTYLITKFVSKINKS